jgi:hypothetical protein
MQELKDLMKSTNISNKIYKQVIEEQMVPASLKDLKMAMLQDQELNVFLNTPATELPDNYKYLVGELTNEIEDTTLFHIIYATLNWKISGLEIHSFFSKSGDKFKGVVAYMTKGNEVVEIKTFSFNPSQGGGAILIRDFDPLIDELVKKYDKVSWRAVKDNPANKIYQRVIEKYDGQSKNIGDVIEYVIQGSIERNKLKTYKPYINIEK